MTLVSDFDFALPDELIAQDARPRGESRLMVMDRASGALRDSFVRELPSLLRAGDVLVANDTRVFPARLLGHRVPSGGAVECLLLAPTTDPRSPIPDPRSPIPDPRFPIPDPRSPIPDPRSPIQEWTALMHPGQKLKPGALVRFAHHADLSRASPSESRGLSRASASESRGVLMAEVLERQYFGRRRIRLWAEGDADVDALVDAMGHVPLPPYIHRADTPADRERYQTVFAAHRGSIAAPTAGLHFDAPLLDAIESAGVERVTVTLHVGYGTFKPVRAERVEEHVVDPEPYEITAAAAQAINAALDAGRRIVAVGTTTTRALEDAALRGEGRVRPGRGDAALFIYPGRPGFAFRVVSGLMTNFHLPKSSLLMLVAAFAGRERVLAAYREAVQRRYRFYSYGDAMVIL